jgi:hypothetical protein
VYKHLPSPPPLSPAGFIQYSANYKANNKLLFFINVLITDNQNFADLIQPFRTYDSDKINSTGYRPSATIVPIPGNQMFTGTAAFKLATVLVAGAIED